MRLLILFHLVLIAFSSLSAQSTDTIELVKQLQQDGKYSEIAPILKQYTNDHPEHLYSHQLYASMLYLLGEADKADSVYQKMVIKYPDQETLRLEYGRMLFDVGKLREAERQFVAYQGLYPDNTEANLKLGYIYYWLGYYKKSQLAINRILRQHPDHPEASEISRRIEMIFSPRLNIKSSYLDDSQPLNRWQTAIGVKWLRSRFFEPHIAYSTSSFNDTTGTWTKSHWIQIGNSIFIAEPNIRASMEFGHFRHPTHSSYWTGKILLSKTTSKHLEVTAKVTKEPYTHSLLSLHTPVMVNKYEFTAGWNDYNFFNGLSAYNLRKFEDDNILQTFYTWFLLPPMKVSPLEIRLGAAYSFSDSERNNFTSVKNLSEILDNYDPAEKIDGIYDPYHTPNNQHIVSALGIFQYKLASKIQLNLNINTGIYSRADIPNLFLNTRNSGELFIDREYFEEKKVTMELSTALTFMPSTKITLKGGHKYYESFFFHNHEVFLAFHYIFSNEK